MRQEAEEASLHAATVVIGAGQSADQVDIINMLRAELGWSVCCKLPWDPEAHPRSLYAYWKPLCKVTAPPESPPARKIRIQHFETPPEAYICQLVLGI